MERRRQTPREALRKSAIPLIMTGAIIAACSIWEANYNVVKGVEEARNISLPNASSKELANAISLQETKAINGT